MLDVFVAASKLIRDGRRGALATIINTTGSTPGKTSSKLLVRDDGTTVGTVGGGCTENDIWKLAMQVMVDENPVRTRFRLTAATAAETGLLCGGEFEVFIEPIGNPAVFVFGAGHIARSLARVLQPLEYQTTVLDDRESFVVAEHFPTGTKLQICDFDDCLADLHIGPNAQIVIVTRGHEHDERVLGQAIMTEAQYVGVIGSRGKLGAIFKNLRKAGIPEERLREVRGPIGLNIGSRSPEEVAISISAELIACRRGVAPEPRNPARSRTN